MSTKNDVELDPEVNIELVESITVKSESKFDEKKEKLSPSFVGWLLVFASIPMGYTIQSFSFTADFMPFTCEKDIDGIAKFEGQYVRDLQFMSNTTRELYSTNHTEISERVCAEIEQGGCKVVFHNKKGFKSEQRTLRVSYNLICDREWLLPLSTTMAFCGNAVGSLVGGWFSDRFGRRPVYLFSVLIQGATIAALFFAPNLPVYLGLIWISIFFQMIAFQVGFVLVSELVKEQLRVFFLAAYMLIFTVGCMALPIVGYYFPSWRYIFLIGGLIRFLAVPYIWIIPESPKWLKDQENNKMRQQGKDTETVIHENYYMIIFKNTTLLKRVILCSMMTFMQQQMYYFTQINATNVGTDNAYRNTILNASIDIPSGLLAYLFAEYLGRRKTGILNSFVTLGLILLGIWIDSFFVASTILSKASLSILSGVAWTYCSELFPTKVRNSAVGIIMFFGQIGSMVSPYLVELGRGNSIFVYSACIIQSTIVTLIYLLLPETDTIVDEIENI